MNTYTIIATNKDNEFRVVDLVACSSDLAIVEFAKEIHEYGWHIADILDIRVVKADQEGNRRDFEVQQAALQLLKF